MFVKEIYFCSLAQTLGWISSTAMNDARASDLLHSLAMTGVAHVLTDACTLGSSNWLRIRIGRWRAFAPRARRDMTHVFPNFCKKQVGRSMQRAVFFFHCSCCSAFLHLQDPGFGEFQGQALSQVVKCIFCKISIIDIAGSYCTLQVNKILPSGCAFITCQEVKVGRVDAGPATWPHLPGVAMKHLRISMIKMLMCTALSGSKGVLLWRVRRYCTETVWDSQLTSIALNSHGSVMRSLSNVPFKWGKSQGLGCALACRPWITVELPPWQDLFQRSCEQCWQTTGARNHFLDAVWFEFY